LEGYNLVRMSKSTIKLRTNKGEREIPTDWSTLSTDKYQQWVQLGTLDIVKTMSCFYDLKEDYILSLDETSEVAITLFAAIDFVRFDPHLQDLRMPDSVVVAGKTVKLRNPLNSLAVGQAMQLRRKLETTDTFDEAISFCAAVYLQPYLDGAPFDLNSALIYEQEILKLPIMTTYPIGFFFLPSIRISGGVSKSYLHLIRKLLIPSTNKLPRWQKLLGSRGTKILT